MIVKTRLPFINHQIKWFITRFLVKLSPTQIIYWSPNQRKYYQIELLATKCWSWWNGKLLNQLSILNYATHERKHVFEALKWNGNASKPQMLKVCFLIFNPHRQLTASLITVLSHSYCSFTSDQKIIFSVILLSFLVLKPLNSMFFF